MEKVNIFEQAVRNKVRFNTPSGLITVEDLWDLKLTGRLSLDTLAKSLNKQIKEEEEESFVVKKSQSNTILALMFELVKYVISVKLEEQEASKNAVEVKARKEKLLSLLADKEEDDDKGKSKEELLEELSKLG